MHGLAGLLWISYLSVQVLRQLWTLLFVSFCTNCWAKRQSSSLHTHSLTWALIWGPLRAPKLPNQRGGQGPLSILPSPQWLHALHSANTSTATVKTHCNISAKLYYIASCTLHDTLKIERQLLKHRLDTNLHLHKPHPHLFFLADQTHWK